MADTESSGNGKAFQPRIVAFFCNWCTYAASDLAGASRMKYPANARVIRLMCSGRLDPQFVLAALRQGADGVLVGGCPPGDCHFQEGNSQCRRRFELLCRLVAQLGIEPQRLRLEWISASEADKLRDVVDGMVKQLKELGPLRLEPIPRPEGPGAGDLPPAGVAAEGAPP